MLKQLQQNKYVSYAPGSFGSVFALINKNLSKLSNSLNFLRHTEYYATFEHEFLVFA